MLLTRARLIVQHLFFIILTYGGRFGISLGPSMPCFVCPYVSGCAGHCYLMGIQGFIGLGLGAKLFGLVGLKALGYFALFVLLVALLGKTWCGWICPFGLVQDWLSMLRKKLGVREGYISPRAMSGLGWVKYALLACLTIFPLFITAGLLHPDFNLPFCNICPAKAIMPLFAGDARYLSLDLTNAVTAAFSALLLIIAAITLVGSFFKDRFFCLFCPHLALIHLLKPLNALRLVKKPQSCHGCGSCRRACPMDIEKVYSEKAKSDVQAAECLNCGTCVEACASNRTLTLKWFGLKLLESSRRLALGIKKDKA
jgi:polyferredoxin